MEPLLSIIIPAFNIEQYISRCLDSIINQSYKNIEIIVVNDGSTDNTGDIIDSYVKKDNRVKVIHKKNEGVSIARNTAIHLAKGDYIGFVDGDDTIDNDMFETLVKNAINYNADISHCGYKMIFPSRIDYYYDTGDIIIQDNYEGIRDLLNANIVEPGLWNKIYRSNLFDGISLNPFIKNNEDLLVNFYLFKKSTKSVFYDKCMYNYMIRSESATTQKINKNKIQDPILVMEEIKNNLDKKSDLYIISYKRYLSNLIRVCRNKECRKHINYKKYIMESKKKLHEEIKNNNNKKIMGIKIKYMIYGVLYLPLLFNIIDEIHGIISGNKYKYEVK